MKKMKIIKVAGSILMMLIAVQMSAQTLSAEETKNQKGLMNATTTHTLAYMKDGVERPYKVTVREKRTSIAKFDKADLGQVNQDRIPTPENVA